MENVRDRNPSKISKVSRSLSDLNELSKKPEDGGEEMQQRGEEFKISSLFKTFRKCRLTFESTEMETIYMYDSIIKRKGMIYGGYFAKVMYPFSSSHEYDVLKEHGIM